MRVTAPAVVAVAALALTVPAAAATTGVVITMPEPTGKHAVGTTDLHLVDRRPDPWRPAKNREVMVTVTYPTDRHADLQFAVPQMGDLVSPERRRGVVGEIDATRSLTAQYEYFTAYFDLHLKGRGTSLFRGDSPDHPDVRFI
ncbi:hypothetical protein AB0K14_01615 [Actinosynnema sp. NPDC050801]|uniref:hypothetical protein n=1 Tax=unclassified Actinosynnema TaxID=2637065 RepID=UPI0033EFF2AD